jgi:membrane fusion protein (multidrug efflux system)
VNTILRILLWPITFVVRLVNKMVAHFFNHPNGGLHLVIGVQALVIVAMGTWIALEIIQRNQAASFKPNFPKIAVEALPVKVGNFDQFITAVGTLRSNYSIVVKPEIDAKIKDIFVKSGQKVKKGAKLLSLDDSLYTARVKEANAKLVYAKSHYKRAAALFEKGAIAAKDKEESYANLVKSEADVDFANAQLAKTKLYAPFEGVVGLIDLSPGKYVKPGDDLFTLDDTDPIKVDFKVPEILISKLKVGDEIMIDVDGFPDNKYSAKLEAIDTNIDPLGHSIRIQASFENVGGDLRPGLFARVKLRTETHTNTIMVPESAVESRGKQEYVYIVEKGVAKMAPVKTGFRNGENVQVTRGLFEGDQVIYAGQMKVQPNYPVTVIPPRVKKG